MKNKKGNNKSNNKLMLIGIMGIVLISLIGFVILVSALTDNDKTALQDELNNFLVKNE